MTKRVSKLDNRSKSILIAVSLLAPFMIGYQEVFWESTGNLRIAWEIRGTVLVVMSHGLYLDPRWISLILLRIVYAYSIIYYDGSKGATIVFGVSVFTNLIAELGICYYFSTVFHLINTPGFYTFILDPTSWFMIYLPIPIMLVTGLFYLRRIQIALKADSDTGTEEKE